MGRVGHVREREPRAGVHAGPAPERSAPPRRMPPGVPGEARPATPADPPSPTVAAGTVVDRLCALGGARPGEHPRVLTTVYRKLDIKRRGELSQALAGP